MAFNAKEVKSKKYQQKTNQKNYKTKNKKSQEKSKKLTKKIDLNKIYKENDMPTYSFPKYSTQLLNLANQNSQATRPKYLGSMAEMFSEMEEKTFKEWKKVFNEKNKDKIDEVVDKIYDMLQNLKSTIDMIDKKMVRNWVDDLTLNKSFEGFVFQEVILKEISNDLNKNYRLSTKDEEAKGIDGFIDDVPVQIKSKKYKSKTNTKHEEFDFPVIYYEKTNGKLKFDFNPDDF